jgi:hypothetical protein
MSGKDYKDALNELRLGSSFCEEMEKKLSEEIAEADEYTDEVTHVDVVPERRHKGLAIAAAAVLLIGGGCGGLLYHNRDTFLGTPSNEDSIYYDKKTFAFPFGSADLHGMVFDYSFGQYMSHVPPVVATEEMGEELVSLFSITKFEKLDTVAFSDIFTREAICFSNDYYYADFYDNGIIEVSFIQDDIYREYYKVSDDTFAKMRDIIFGNEGLTMLDKFGIKADLSDAQLHIENYDGPLTVSEAISLAAYMNYVQWNPRDTDELKDSSDTMTLDIESEGRKYEIIIGDNGKASVDVDGTVSYYSFAAVEYENMKSIVDKGVQCPCPIEYNEEEPWMVTAHSMERMGGAVYGTLSRGAILSEDEKKELFATLEGIEWKKMNNSNQVGYFTYDGVIIQIGDITLHLWPDGNCILETSPDNPEFYRIEKEDYEAVRAIVTKECAEFKDDDELADYMIDLILYEDSSDKFFMLKPSGQETMLQYYTFETGEKELKQLLKDVEWTVDTSGVSYASTTYPVFKNLMTGQIYITTDGIMVINSYDLCFRSKGSEKLIAHLKELKKSAAEKEKAKMEEKADNAENSETSEAEGE